MFLFKINSNNENADQNNGKRTNRPDKYTPGLFNNRNDCFANSTIQALSSLQFLSKYLNLMNEVVRKIAEMEEQHIQVHEKPQFKEVSPFMLSTMEKMKTDANIRSLPSNATITVDYSMNDSTKDLINKQNKQPTFLKEKKAVQNLVPLHKALSKILFELQQTHYHIETLSLQPFLKTMETIFNARISSGQNDAHEFQQVILDKLQQEHEELNKYLHAIKEQNSLESAISLSEFPTRGKLCVQLVCTNCGQSSKLNVCDFNILTLPLPQQSECDLDDLIANNQMETIEGYYCVVCNLRNLFANSPTRDLKNLESLSTMQDLETLAKRVQNADVYINEDLAPELETFLKTKSQMHSTIVKKTVIVEAPQILIVHLSRSIFNGMTSQRNDCLLNFHELLNLQEQHLFQTNNDKSTGKGLLGPKSNISVKMKPYMYKIQSIIRHSGTHHFGHYECYKRKPVFYKDLTNGGYIDKSTRVINPTFDEEVCSPTDISTPLFREKFIDAQSTLNNAESNIAVNDEKAEETTMAASEGTILQASTGTEVDSTILDSESSNLSSLSLEEKSDVELLESEMSTHSMCARSASISSISSTASNFSLSRTNTASSQKKWSSVSSGANLVKQDSNQSSKRRPSIVSKVSGLLSRRTSVFSLESDEAPAKEELPNGSLANTSESQPTFKTSSSKQKSSLKKLKSCIEYPFWRISDHKVSESSSIGVLKNERKYCYMLYYELNL
ncbi:hypothetical protein ACO0QE_002537 [Hanseniaspora vineae]